jgi:dynactin-4
VIPPKRHSREVELEEELEVEDKTFDPRHPRSNFSLLPPEHLLHCDECHEIKCPRCIIEEIICWYCPSCLFETPSSTVRSEGNRCARNCFSCPVCSSQMITTSLTDAKEGPWILNCNYCMWNTLEIGIKFQKPTNIRAQLEKIENGGGERRPSKVPEPDRKSSLSREPFSPLAKQDDADPMDKIESPPPSDPASRFNALRSFYKDQLLASAGSDPAFSASGAEFAYSSPSSLNRLMNLYANNGTSMKKTNQRPTIMREALTPSEGLSLSTHVTTSVPEFEPYTSSTSPTQRLAQNPTSIGNPSARHVRDLRPMPALLRTKRNKRCKDCKHILIRPEFKPTSTRYRIKLIALNYIPLVSLRPLNPPGASKIPTSIDGGDVVLEPAKPSQWILTLRNHLFDAVQVSLGTPSVTPGKHGHRVTILCPQFEVGANSDVWDDALNSKDEKDAVASPGVGPGDQIAGKIYERGRNWTSVVLEIVPGSIVKMNRTVEGDQEDEGVVELPIRVRLDWKQSDPGGAEGEKKKSEKLTEDGVDEGRRELAYWMVLGVGRVGVIDTSSAI